MRFVLDIGLWFGPNDIEHRTFVISDPDITEWDQALWLIRDWIIDIGHTPAPSSSPEKYPTRFRRATNITSFTLLETS